MFQIYLDACAVNRITDDPSQARVRAEADAVQEIARLLSDGLIRWTASEILSIELLRNPDTTKLQEAMLLLEKAGPLLPRSGPATIRAEMLAGLGYGLFDAFHLASAEEAEADVLLTTDDRFLRRALRGVGMPAVRVVNPVDWLREVQPWFPPTR